MKTDHFEDILKNITKPEVPELKHEDMLSQMIMKVKDKSVVSFWWLCIPLYIIAAFLMKSSYYPKTTFTSILHEFTNTKNYISVLIFFVLPVLLIVINLITIKQLSFLFSGLTKTEFLKTIVTQIVIILFSLFVLSIYLL